MDEELALQGLFLYLMRNGFQLSVRDYHDALKALQAGYGLPLIQMPTPQKTRDHLLWLCQTLWARSDDEVRTLSLLFKRFPYPTQEEVRELTGDVAPEPPSPARKLDDSSTSLKPEADQSLESEPAPRIQFAPTTQPGLGLTRAQAEPMRDEPFILTPQPPIPLRALIIAWRRFRLAMRTGPKVELDLDATINEQCRRGLLTEPVLIPARRNQAKLILLIDASCSMRPWRSFNPLLTDSLHQGQLSQAPVYYFHNVPDPTLYERETLTSPVQLDQALKDHAGSTLLIISDAGAARGFRRRDRIDESEAFISKAWSAWQPIVWLNPMPPHRWKGSSAEAISRLTNLTMFELNEERLINAVDVLRGQRRA